MTRRAKTHSLAVSFMLICGVARGQPPVDSVPAIAERYIDPRGGLSLADAVAHAVEREPSLRAARKEVDAARGTRVQAGLRPNPTVSFERRGEPAGTDNQTMAQIEWPLDVFRRSARVALAEQETVAAGHAVADRVRLLIADVRMRYGQAAAAIRDLTVADEVAASARRQLDLVRRRVDEGAAPPLERDRLDIEARRLEAEQLLAVGRTDAAMVELRRVLGMPADAVVRLRQSLEALVVPYGEPRPNDPTFVTVLDAETARERPDVRQAEARVAVADARIEQVRSEGRIDVTLFASYMRMDTGFAQRGFDERGDLARVRGVFHYVGGGTMVSVPLRDRRQGELIAAQAERAGAAVRLEAAKLSAQAEIAAALAQDARAREAVSLYEGATRLARQNLEVTQQTYSLGRATASEVLAEQRRRLDVEHAYTDALRTAYEARTALQRARGEWQ